ncbi:MAG: DUF6174 domain-containing protein [Burkholderiaceae bacterium]
MSGGLYLVRRGLVWLGWLMLGAMLALAGCGDDRRLANVSEAEIAAKSQAWAQHQISDYTMVYRESCFCESGEITVVVRGGKLENATREVNGVTGVSAVQNPQTVAGLFDLIRRARQEADELEVRFDDALDFPDRISIDWYRNAVDDEYGLTVVRLTRQ